MDAKYANRLGWFRQFKENINASNSTLIVGIDIIKKSQLLILIKFDWVFLTGCFAPGSTRNDLSSAVPLYVCRLLRKIQAIPTSGRGAR
jgi:hypothetical protein